MKTPYTVENQTFSNKAHNAAKKYIYPRVFKNPDISIRNTILGTGEAETILDGQLAIDRIIQIPSKSLNGTIKLTVQERFRKPTHAKFRDIAITEWNNASGLEGELYKLHSNLFVYGYYDDVRDTFIEIVVVDVPMLLMRIATNTIDYTRTYFEDKRQSAINVKFDDIKATRCLIYAARNIGHTAVP